MNTLPREIRYSILVLLPYNDIVKYCKTSQRNYNICYRRSFWSKAVEAHSDKTILFNDSVRRGWVEFVRVLYKQMKIEDWMFDDALELSCKFNNRDSYLAVLKLINSRYCYDFSQYMTNFRRNLLNDYLEDRPINVELIKYLLDEKITHSEVDIAILLTHNNTDLIELLFEYNIKFDLSSLAQVFSKFVKFNNWSAVKILASKFSLRQLAIYNCYPSRRLYNILGQYNKATNRDYSKMLVDYIEWGSMKQMKALLNCSFINPFYKTYRLFRECIEKESSEMLSMIMEDSRFKVSSKMFVYPEVSLDIIRYLLDDGRIDLTELIIVPEIAKLLSTDERYKTLCTRLFEAQEYYFVKLEKHLAIIIKRADNYFNVEKDFLKMGGQYNINIKIAGRKYKGWLFDFESKLELTNFLNRKPISLEKFIDYEGEWD